MKNFVKITMDTRTFVVGRVGMAILVLTFSYNIINKTHLHSEEDKIS